MVFVVWVCLCVCELTCPLWCFECVRACVSSLIHYWSRSSGCGLCNAINMHRFFFPTVIRHCFCKCPNYRHHHDKKIFILHPDSPLLCWPGHAIMKSQKMDVSVFVAKTNKKLKSAQSIEYCQKRNNSNYLNTRSCIVDQLLLQFPFIYNFVPHCAILQTEKCTRL